MSTIKYVPLVLFLIIAFITGCTNKCAEQDTITDPVQREKLIQECSHNISDSTVPTKQKTTKEVPEPVEKNADQSAPEPSKQQHSKWFKPSKVVNW
jgi:hypothetical protein